ncbi:leucine-rich repeat and immunoglobulin-like domain-containing nogo receptor-interacting protein 2 [Gigantopelta aegis]|uniref:leucine-rich repeat and immunoglobulin-like domain-containing nogo receptor-interacting protein 2 n=1 Tax=Gigantopelta aegis TaxID=1735272 RepID=UPI001B888641|nr:leucine-rich repeat and immunoglobulin-like domain-containing nogo receptor-interacting protein 2 [Gigantopelta aegis]
MTWIPRWRPNLFLFLLLLVVAALANTSSQNTPCPFGCTCEDTVVSCRGGNLTSLPGALPHPSKITHVVVSGQNGVTTIGNQLRQCIQLQLLNLSANNISVIEDGAFADLSNLSTLILRRNYLHWLDEDTFKGLGLLDNLDLGYNGLTVIRNNTFRELGSLRKLDFTKNHISVVDKDAFRGLTSLVVLNMTRNLLKTVPPFVFSHLRSLEILVLDDNLIEELPDFAFSGLDSLKILRLNGNRLTRISALTFVFQSRKASMVEHLYLKGTNLTEFPEKALSALHNLKTLDLSQSNIKVLHNGSFDKLINLRKLVLVGLNNLTVIENHTFTWLYKLEELTVSRNPVLHTLGGLAMTSFLGNLRLVDFSYNSIKVFHKNMVAWDSDVIVDLTHNAIECDCRAAWMIEALPTAKNPLTRRNGANLTCSGPLGLKDRKILTLPYSAFDCDVTLFGNKDVNRRVKMAAITAAVTSILLITILILIKFRIRWLSFFRRQYRYRSYKNNGMFTVDKNGNCSEEGVPMDVIYTHIH